MTSRRPALAGFILSVIPWLSFCTLAPQPIQVDCTASYDCDGVEATRGQLCMEGRCGDCTDDFSCVRVAHYGAGSTCQAGRCVAPAQGDAGGNNGTDAGGSVCRGGDGDFACACFPNNTCNAGLTCSNGVCTGTAPGTEGGACFPNGTCLGTLACGADQRCRAPVNDAGTTDASSTTDAATTDASTADAAVTDAAVADASTTDAAMTDASVPDASTTDASTPDAATADASTSDDAGTLPPCTGTTGQRHCACFPNGTCMGGLGCTDNRCDGPLDGTADGPCYANRTCNAGLACDTGGVCRVEPGTSGGACVGGTTCNAGLQCVAGTCQAPAAGSAGGACLAGNTCNTGLVCGASSTCRAPLPCGNAGCAANQVCQASTASADALCLPSCRPGFDWNTTTSSCDAVAGSACAPDAAVSLAAACAAIHETCEDADGPARCDACLPGYVRDQGSCRAVVTCAALSCGLDGRVCIPESSTSDARCGGCTADTVDTGNACVALLPSTCDESLAGGSLRERCATDHRSCLEGPARCGSCVTGWAENAANGTCQLVDPRAGVPVRLGFWMQPSSVVAGALFDVGVEVLDALGVRVEGATPVVGLALLPVGGVVARLGGTAQVTAVNGTALLQGLSVDVVGGGFTLVASSSGLTSAFSVGFDVTARPPAPRLRWLVQPSTVPPNVAMTPAPQVELLDAAGARDVTPTGAVTVALGVNPAGGTLGGTLSAMLVNGVATFPDLVLGTTAAGYTLRATTDIVGVELAESVPFAVGNAPRLSFLTQPANAPPGNTITPAVQVELLDGNGNRDTSVSLPVTLTLGTNPGAGTLSGTTTVNLVAGVATFTDLAINNGADGYTLVASIPLPYTPAITSAPFNITTAGQNLAFTAQPTNVPVGSPVQVQVELRNVSGQRLSSSSAPVTLVLGNNPGNATLGGTTTVNAVNGVASFSVTVDQAAAGYTLRASAAGFLSVTSRAFSVGVSTPAGARLVFSVQPQVVVAATAFQVSAEIRDQGNNIITDATDLVTLSLFTNPASGILAGTLTQRAVAGRVDFPGLAIATAGGGYSLVATASGIEVGLSNAFDVVPGQPASFRYRQHPTSVVAGEVISPAVEVELLDVGGNFVNTATDFVTLSIGSGSSPALLGTTTVAAVNGVATFSNLSLQRSGSHRLRASGAGMTSLDSGSFTVSAAAAVELAFLVQPSNATATLSISPNITVARRDAFGNTVPGSGFAVTVGLGNNPGGATLSGTLTVNTASSGVASFSAVRLDKVGTGYTLTASGGTFAPATSAPFNVAAGAPASLRWRTQPSDVVAGEVITPAPQAEVLDSGGNVVETATTAVVVSIQSGTGTLSGTLTVNAVAGVATFPDLSFTGTGNAGAKVLRLGTLGPNVSSATFTVSHAAPHNAVFTTNASSVTAGVAMAPAPVVRVRDRFNNTCTTFTGEVTLSIGTNPSAGVLLGAVTAGAVAGDATFSDVRLDKVGGGYTLVGTFAGATTPATSAAFNVGHAAAARLGYATPPSNVRSMATMTPAVRVQVQDAFGNHVTSCCTEYDIRLALVAPQPGTLFGADADRTSVRTATFSNLRFDAVGSYTLVASHATLGTVSATFDVTAGAWAPSNTGLDAAVTRSVVVDPVTPTTLYAATMGAGVFKSTDGGATWSSASIGLRNRNVRALAVDPVTPTTLYAGTDWNAFKSVNGGATWTELVIPSPRCCNLAVRQMVVSPSNPQVVWMVRTDGDVNRSTDGGATWTWASASSVIHVAVDPTNAQVAYGATGGGLYRTANGGGSGWVDLGRNNATTVVVDPTTPTTIYAGTEHGDGVWKSLNSGTSWTKVSTGLTPTGLFSRVVHLAMAPSDPQALYAYYTASNASFDHLLFRTTNGGTSWTQVATTGRLNPDTLAMVVHPQDPMRVLLGLNGAGVYASADGGETFTASNVGLHGAWTSHVAVDPSNASILYASTRGGGGFKSVDGGATWTRLAALDPLLKAMAVAASNNQVLYAITHTRILRSTDGGSSFAEVNTAPASRRFSSIAVDPTNPSIAYAGHGDPGFPYDGNLVKTTDGTTWTAQSPSLGKSVSAVAVDPANPASVWVTLNTEQAVFNSTDRGATAFVGKGAALGAIQCLAIDPASMGNTLYVGSGIIRKTTNGSASPATWVSASTGFPADTYVRTLAVDPTSTQTVYAAGWNGDSPSWGAGTTGTNVRRTDDGGGNWSFAGSGLVSELVNTVAHSPAATGVAWAATEGAGVFKTVSGGL